MANLGERTGTALMPTGSSLLQPQDTQNVQWEATAALSGLCVACPPSATAGACSPSASSNPHEPIQNHHSSLRWHGVINASDTALIFEGGGMRGSYTAACVVELIERGVDAGWVGGISAGASHTFNYLSRDVWRARTSFTDFAANPQFGGWRSLARGTGWFNAEYIYERSADRDLPFDMDAYRDHPADVHIEATRADTGETVAWTRPDLQTSEQINVRVRASSTLPLVMNLPVIDGVAYVDGALGSSGGLLIDAAEAAGYEKFLVVMSRPREYRKSEVARPAALRRLLRRWPAVAEAQIARPAIYNAAKERILELEAEGKARVFFPETMPVNVGELKADKLRASYEAGRRQAEDQWPAAERFLRG